MTIMKKPKSNFNSVIFLIIALAILSSGFFYHVAIKDAWAGFLRKRAVPKAQPATLAPDLAQKKTVAVAPLEVNLAVPFVEQAPYRVWDAVHEETCEEASLIMVDGFYKNVKTITPLAAEAGLLKLVDYQKLTLGFFEDTDAAQTARILRDYFGYKNAAVTYDISINDIKKELAAGRPVIVPAAGKLLGNPYFRGGGPDYHMLVIKGYTKDGRFITNDPGTRRGADYLYKFDKLYQAINDWDSVKHGLSGRKAMIVVSR
jgi:hypothetical protein